MPVATAILDGNGYMAYRPTSLDYINRPNPVEPHAVPEKHPLNDTQRFESADRPRFRRLISDQSVSENAERPTKRRKSGEAKLLDLPQLPAVKNGSKRLRIPPTLSGLHQPPPNAGILPSISVDQPVSLPTRNVVLEAPPLPSPGTAQDDSAKPVASILSKSRNALKKQRRNKWSNEESDQLLKGVAKFGIGNWTKILNCPDYHFEDRNAIDLKDRFRVCCPDEYKSSQRSGKAELDNAQRKNEDTTTKGDTASRREHCHRKSSAELVRLGITEPFERSNRRVRTNYTSAEDEALVLGFRKYGKSWARIREDPSLKLAHRKATDLRDRFRTHFADTYNAATRSKNRAKVAAPGTEASHPARSEKENELPVAYAPAKKQPLASLLPFEPDVFWGAPFDADDIEPERLTLDRRILDWPAEIIKSTATDGLRSETDPAKSSSSQRQHAATSQHGPENTKGSVMNSVLPSLADITACSDDLADHLELPSLMGTFETLDNDVRVGGQFPSLEELWK